MSAPTIAAADEPHNTPTTTEQIAGLMVSIACGDLGRTIGALLRGDLDRADSAITDAIRQLEAARRMIRRPHTNTTECRGQITLWFCEPCGNTSRVTGSDEP